MAAAVPRDRPWTRCTADTAGSPIAAKLAGTRCACANSQRARASDTQPELSAGWGGAHIACPHFRMLAVLSESIRKSWQTGQLTASELSMHVWLSFICNAEIDTLGD